MIHELSATAMHPLRGMTLQKVTIQCGRGDRIRTCDPLVPNQVRYQPAPLPDVLVDRAALR
jgi:hypothetical protein